MDGGAPAVWRGIASRPDSAASEMRRAVGAPAARAPGNGFGHFRRNKSAPPADAGTRSDNEVILDQVFASYCKNHRVLNPRGISAHSISHTTTSLTSAAGGPSHSHSHRSATDSDVPQTSTSTRPSSRFLAYPLKPSSAARRAVLARKNTPWTRPETKHCLQMFMFRHTL